MKSGARSCYDPALMFIPHDQLNPETLDALIEEFITRHGAVHGHHETPLSTLIAQVKSQLRSGKVLISYDEESESCSIVSAQRPPEPTGRAEPKRNVTHDPDPERLPDYAESQDYPPDWRDE